MDRCPMARQGPLRVEITIYELLSTFYLLANSYWLNTPFKYYTVFTGYYLVLQEVSLLDL